MKYIIWNEYIAIKQLNITIKDKVFHLRPVRLENNIGSHCSLNCFLNIQY